MTDKKMSVNVVYIAKLTVRDFNVTDRYGYHYFDINNSHKTSFLWDLFMSINSFKKPNKSYWYDIYNPHLEFTSVEEFIEYLPKNVVVDVRDKVVRTFPSVSIEYANDVDDQFIYFKTYEEALAFYNKIKESMETLVEL